MGWTDERVELLKKLWADGLSASQIASQLGSITRNAVIGKVHRLGLSGRTKTATVAPRNARPKARAHAPQASRPSIQPMSFGATALKAEAYAESHPLPATMLAPAIPFPVPSIGDRVTILQLTERSCRWPVGDPASSEFRFCGSQSETSQPYCPYHCAIAYQPVADRKRDRDRKAAGSRG